MTEHVKGQEDLTMQNGMEKLIYVLIQWSNMKKHQNAIRTSKRYDYSIIFKKNNCKNDKSSTLTMYAEIIYLKRVTKYKVIN